MLHYGQRITQVCFNSISMDSDYHNAVICLCLWTANNALIFAVFFLIFVACHVTFNSVVETPTLPQVVFNSLIKRTFLFFTFCLGSFTKISDLNFQAYHVIAKLKKFTKMWTKAFVLLVVFLMYIFSHYWQKWLVDVILYLPWSTDSFETHLFEFYCYVTLWTASNASLF